MREQGGAILLGREQHEVGEALRHQGRDLNQIVGAALDVLSHEFVDVTVQAIGHSVLARLSTGPPPISRTNEQRGSRMLKARRGGTTHKDNARSMLRLIQGRIRSSD